MVFQVTINSDSSVVSDQPIGTGPLGLIDHDEESARGLASVYRYDISYHFMFVWPTNKYSLHGNRIGGVMVSVLASSACRSWVRAPVG